MVTRRFTQSCVKVAWSIVAAVVSVSLSAGPQDAGRFDLPASLSGMVVDAVTGKPVADAMVTTTGGGRRPPSIPGSGDTITDDNGRFEIEVPAGRYWISARQYGRSGSYGQRAASSLPGSVNLTAGQHLANLTIPLWAAPTLAGRVTDESDRPIRNVVVHAFRCIGGAPIGPGAPEARTNDLGEYEIAVTSPGEYAVAVPVAHTTVPGGIGSLRRDAGLWILHGPTDPSGQFEIDLEGMPRYASSRGEPVQTYVTTFAPGVTAASSARIVRVAAGEDVSGVDIQMRPAPAFRVSGRIGGISPAADATDVVWLMRDDTMASLGLPDARAATANGEFVMLDVPQGQYTLLATRHADPRLGATTSPGDSGAVSVSVGDRDLDGVLVTVRSGVKVSGRLEFDTPPPGNVSAIVVLSPQGIQGASIGSGILIQGAFTLSGVSPGRYAVHVQMLMPGPSWTERSVTVGGRENRLLVVSDEDVEDVVIQMTSKTTTLGGAVSGPPELEGDCRVLLVPAGVKLEQVDPSGPFTTACSDGHYRFPNLPPGDYLLVAVDPFRLHDWPAPSLIQSLVAGATRVTLATGDAKMINLQVVR